MYAPVAWRGLIERILTGETRVPVSARARTSPQAADHRVELEDELDHRRDREQRLDIPAGARPRKKPLA